MSAALAAPMPTPGAVISGLAAWSPSRGPWDDDGARRFSASTEPTDSAEFAVDGALTEPGAPSLPAAITNSAPDEALSASTACDIGSVPSEAPDPRLMLTTRACCPTAHSMPATICEYVPQPVSSRTLPTTSRVSGATPAYRPREAAPLPVMIDATCVPCPLRSIGPTASPVKSADAATASERSGWFGSIPESSTAVRTPAPVRPACHACGAPICGTLRSSDARTRPSSQIRAMPGAAVFAVPASAGPAATVRQNAPASALRSATAWAWMLGSSRPGTELAATEDRAAAVPGPSYRTMSGSTGVRRSSKPSRTNPVTSNSAGSNTPRLSSARASDGTTVTEPFRVDRRKDTSSRPGAGVAVTACVPPANVSTVTTSPVISVTDAREGWAPAGPDPGGPAAGGPEPGPDAAWAPPVPTAPTASSAPATTPATKRRLARRFIWALLPETHTPPIGMDASWRDDREPPLSCLRTGRIPLLRRRIRALLAQLAWNRRQVHTDARCGITRLPPPTPPGCRYSRHTNTRADATRTPVPQTSGRGHNGTCHAHADDRNEGRRYRSAFAKMYSVTPGG